MSQINSFDQQLSQFFSTEADQGLVQERYLQERELRNEIARNEGANQMRADQGELYVDPKRRGGFGLTGGGRDNKTWVGGISSILGFDDEYHENLEARRNSEAMDMTAQGMYGQTNRWRTITRAATRAGLARELGILTNTDGLSRNAKALLQGEYSDFGSIQLFEGAYNAFGSVFPFLGKADTGGARAAAKEVEQYVNEQARRQFGDKFHVEVPVRDEEGNVILDKDGNPKTMKEMEGTFDGKKFYAWATENDRVRLMMEEAGIGQEDFEGIYKIEDALEAVGYQLWQRGQSRRAEATQQEGLYGMIAGIENFGGMIAQDTDIGFELGLEFAMLAGVSVLTGGVGGVVKGTEMAVKWGGRIARYMDATKDAVQRVKLAQAYRGPRWYQAYNEGAKKFKYLFRSYRPGSTMGGNIGQHLAMKYGASAGVRQGAFVAGQLIDGAIGGGGAMIANNMFLQAEQQRLYGDSNIDWSDNLGMGIAMGMGGALAVGYIMRWAGMGGVREYQYNAARKSEKEMAHALYGSSKSYEESSGGIAMQSRYVRTKNEVSELLNELGLEMTPEQFAQAQNWGLGDPAGHLPLHAIRNALLKLRSANGPAAKPTTAGKVINAMVKDADFVAEVSRSSKPDAAGVKHAQKMHVQSDLKKSIADGKDPEIEARTAELEAQGAKDAEAQARSEIGQRRLEEAKKAQAEAEKAADALDAKAEKSVQARNESAQQALEIRQRQADADAELRGDELNKVREEVDSGKKKVAELEKRLAATKKSRKKAKKTGKAATEAVDNKIKAEKAAIETAKAEVEANQAKLDASDRGTNRWTNTDVAKQEKATGGFSTNSKWSDIKKALKSRKKELKAAGIKNWSRWTQAKNLNEALDALEKTNIKTLFDEATDVDAQAKQDLGAAAQKRIEADAYADRVKKLEAGENTPNTVDWDIREKQIREQAAKVAPTGKDVAPHVKPDGNIEPAAMKHFGITDEDIAAAGGMKSVYDPTSRTTKPDLKRLDEIMEIANKRKLDDFLVSDEAVATLIKEGPNALGNQQVGRKASAASEQIARMVESLHEATDVATLFRNETIPNPATYVAPRKMSVDEAKLASKEAKADIKQVLPTADEKAQKMISLAALKNDLIKIANNATDTTPSHRGLVSLDVIEVAASNTVLAGTDFALYFRGAKVGEARGLIQFDLDKIINQIDTTVSHANRQQRSTPVGRKTSFKRLKSETEKEILDNQAAIDELKNMKKARTGATDKVADLEELASIDKRIENLEAENAALTKQLEDAPEGVVVEPTTSRIDSYNEDAQAFRRYQAKKLADYRRRAASIEAEKFRKANPGKTHKGGMTEKEWKNTLIDSLLASAKILDARFAGAVAIDKTYKGNARKFFIDYLKDMKENGMDVGHLGDGQLDFVNPHQAARGIIDIIQGKTNGGESVVRKNKIKEGEFGGAPTIEKAATTTRTNYNGLQPATDADIARVFDNLEYRARVRAIHSINWGQNGAPTQREMLNFLRSGKWKQQSGRSLEGERLELASRVTPPQFRGGEFDNIDEFIIRAQEEMLYRKPVYADFVHDDYGTMAGQMGLVLKDLEEFGEGWAGDYGLIGGFPMMKPMPNSDGSFNMAHHAAMAHALLEPTFMPEILASIRAGRLAKEALDADIQAHLEKGLDLTPEMRERLPSDILRNIDGAQNGVRHMHMIATAIMAEMAGGRNVGEKAEDLFENLWKRNLTEKARIEGKGPEAATGKKDFYIDLVNTTSKTVKNMVKNNAPDLSQTMRLTESWGFWDMIKGQADELGRYRMSAADKSARKMAKPPVMTLPYGAGKPAVKGSVKSFFQTQEITIDGKKMSWEAAFEQHGIGIEQAADQVTAFWLNQKNTHGQSIIEEALSLPGGKETLQNFVADYARRRDPFNTANPEADIMRMKRTAERMVEEGLFDDISVAFTAVQTRARGNAIFQIMRNPAMDNYRMAFFKQQKVVNDLDVQIQNKKAAGAPEEEIKALNSQRKKQREILAEKKAELKLAIKNEPVLRNMDDTSDGMVAREGWDDMMNHKLAQEISRMEMAEEMALVRRSYSKDPAEAAAAMKELTARSQQKGGLPFYEAATRAFNRVEFTLNKNRMTQMAQEQTGTQGLEPLLPPEARGSFFQQTLNDWRNRIVTAITKEANWKGNKAARGLMDIFTAFIEGEATSVVYKESALDAASLAKLKKFDEALDAAPAAKEEAAPAPKKQETNDQGNEIILEEDFGGGTVEVDEMGNPIFIEDFSEPIIDIPDDIRIEGDAKAAAKATADADAKRVSERAALVQKLGKESAERRFESLQGLKGDELEAGINKFVDDFIDPQGTFGFGFYDFKQRGALSVFEGHKRSINNLMGEEFRSYVLQQQKEFASFGYDVSKLDAATKAESFSPAQRKQLLEDIMDLEKQRVESLAMKDVLAQAAAFGDAPIVKNADGTIGYRRSLTDDELMGEWRRASDQLDQAEANRTVDFTKMTPEEEANYRKAHGDPLEKAAINKIETKEDLENTFRSEMAGKELERKINSKDMEAKAEAESQLNFQENAQGGAIGLLDLKPKQHMDAMLGIPALREYSFNMKDGDTGLTGSIMARMDEGQSVVPVEYQGHVSGIDYDAVPQVDRFFDTAALEGMPKDIRDATIKRSLDDHRTKYGLEGMSDGQVYQHRLLMQNFQGLVDQIADIRKKAKSLSKEPSWTTNMINAAKRDFMDTMRTTDDDVKSNLREAWRSDDMSIGMKLYRYDKESGTVQSLVDSAQAPFGPGDKGAADALRNTNAYGALKGSETNYVPFRKVETDMYGKGLVETTFGGAEAYMKGGTTWDTDLMGGRYFRSYDDMYENPDASVHVIHNVDVTGAQTTAGFMAGESLTRGLTEFTIPFKDLDAHIKGMSAEEGEILLGGQGAVMFFEATTGKQIVDPRVVGKNVRRQLTRYEAEFILQNSKNKYVGDALEVSAATGGTTVQRGRSLQSLMDDRNGATRNALMQHAKEEAEVLRYLRGEDDANAKANGLAFDGNRAFFANTLSEDPQMIRRMFSALVRDDLHKASRVIDAIDPTLREGFGLKTAVDPSVKGLARYTNLKDADGLANGFWKEILGDDGETLLDVYGAYRLGGSEEDILSGAHMFDSYREMEFQAIYDKVNTETGGQLRSKLNNASRSLKDFEEAYDFVETIMSDEGFYGWTLTKTDDGPKFRPMTVEEMRVDDELSPRIFEMEAKVEAMQARIREVKNQVNDINNGMLGDGYASTMLKMATDSNNPDAVKIAGVVMKDVDPDVATRKSIWEYLQDHDIGGGRNTRKWDGSAYQNRIVDAAIQVARKTYGEGMENGKPYAERPLYQGDWIDPVTKQPVEPQFFMNGDKFSSISAGHQALNTQFEGLIKAGVLTVPQVRMLRSVYAGLHQDAFAGLRFEAIRDGSTMLAVKDQISPQAKANISSVTDPRVQLGGPMQGRSLTGMNKKLTPDQTDAILDANVKQRPAVYHSDGKTDTVFLLQNRLGSDMDVVDVILHETGHAAFSRMIDNTPLLKTMEVDMNSQPARDALREAIIIMHGGQTNRANAMIEAIMPKGENAKVDVEEFAAQWFSYDMAARTLKDREVLNAAYAGLDKAQPGLGSTIKRMIQAMIGFAERRFKSFASLLKRTDAGTKTRLDTYMQVMRGRTNLRGADRHTPRVRYFGGDGSDPRLAAYNEALARLKQAEQDYPPGHPAREEAAGEVSQLAYELETAPNSRAAMEDDVVVEALDEAFDAADVRAEAEGMRAPTPEPEPKPSAKPVPEAKRTPGEPPKSPDEADGSVPPVGGEPPASPPKRRHFGHFMTDDIDSAAAWFAHNLLPELAVGHHNKMDLETAGTAADWSWTPAENRAFAEVAYSIMMPNAKSNQTFHNKQMMRVGSNEYPVMQLLSNLLDNHTTGDTVASYKGRSAKTLAQVSRQLLSDTADRMALLTNELHHAYFGKDKGKWWKSLNLSPKEADQLELYQISTIATRLLEDVDTDLYKGAARELDALGPATREVVLKMRDQFKKISERVKDDAIRAGILGEDRAKLSGLIPLMLKQEVMSNKTRDFAPRLREEYASAMLRRVDEVQDVDGIIASGAFFLHASPGMSFHNYVIKLQDAIAAGRLDDKIMTAKDASGNKLISKLYSHSKKTTSMEYNLAPYIKDQSILETYKAGISDSTVLSKSGMDYIRTKRQRVLDKTSSKRHPTKVYAADPKQGFSDLRQFILGRKFGSSAHYHMGDSFLSRADLLNKMGDMFETNPDMLSASLARGIGLDAADSLNLSKMFPDMYGMTTRHLLDLAEHMVARNNEAPSAANLNIGLQHLHAAREQLGGGRPNMEKTGSAFIDGMNKYGNDFAMILYGGNMGPAMLAETATVLTLQGIPKLLSNPVRFASIATHALTEGLSPIRKTKMLKYLNYAAHMARGQGSFRNIDRTTDASLGVAGRGMSVWSRLGGAVYSASLGPQVQGFNKAFSAAAATDDLFEKMAAARILKLELGQLPANATPTNKEFRALARKAGFGGKWQLAERMVKSGILDHLDEIQSLARETGAHKKRLFDLEEIAEVVYKKDGDLRHTYEDARRAIWNYLDDSIATFMVEPRVLDMNLTENKGWAKFQDIFMSWTRAFAAQKGAGIGMTRLREGRTVGFGHLAAFAMAQVVWDSIYTSIQEVGRGEDPNKILHQLEEDPVGWYMQKATRLPLFGAYMSQLNSVAVDYARNAAAKTGVPGFGYLGKNSFGVDFTSSPAGGAALKIMNMLMMAPRAAIDGVTGDYTDQRLMSDAQLIRDIIPGFNNMFIKGLTSMAVMDPAQGKSVYEYSRDYDKRLRKERRK